MKKSFKSLRKIKYKNIIKNNKKGSSYIDIALMVFAAVMVVVLACNVFSFLTLKQYLDYVATKVAETAALVGGTKDRANADGEGGTESSTKFKGIDATFKSVCSSEGLEIGTGKGQVTFTVTAPDASVYDSSSGKVQLGEPILVTVTCNASFQGLGALSSAMTIKCQSQKVALSRVYHKDI